MEIRLYGNIVVYKNKMGVEATNRIYNSPKSRKIEFERDLRRIEYIKVKKAIRKKRGCYKHFRIKSATCSKCGRGMMRDMAKIQMENRENVLKYQGYCPICLACINGFKRRDLTKQNYVKSK